MADNWENFINCMYYVFQYRFVSISMRESSVPNSSKYVLLLNFSNLMVFSLKSYPACWNSETITHDSAPLLMFIMPLHFFKTSCVCNIIFIRRLKFVCFVRILFSTIYWILYQFWSILVNISVTVTLCT